MTLTDAPVSTNGSSPAEQAKAATGARINADIERRQRVGALAARGWKVDLSGGQWAVLRDPAGVPERLIRPLKVAQARTAAASADAAGHTTMSMDHEAVILSGYVMVATFVESWSRGEPPTPANLDPLLDLPSRDYAALQTACQDLAAEAMTDYQADLEPTSPFVDSSG